jgi:hypothetical protein
MTACIRIWTWVRVEPMRRLWLLAGTLLLAVGLGGCGAGDAGDTPVPPTQGPALLFFYTDN